MQPAGIEARSDGRTPMNRYAGVVTRDPEVMIRREVDVSAVGEVSAMCRCKMPRGMAGTANAEANRSSGASEMTRRVAAAHPHAATASHTTATAAAHVSATRRAPSATSTAMMVVCECRRGRCDQKRSRAY
jgi:hypothetical protein